MTALLTSTLLALTALIALLAACGEDADTTDSTTPTTDTPVATGTTEGTAGTLTPAPATATPDVSPVPPTPAGTPEGGDAPSAVNLNQTCESDRYTVDYPEGWHANSGEVAQDACGWFSPEPFEVEPNTSLLTEVFMYIDPVAYDDVLSSPGMDETTERSETTVDGFPATRVERPSAGPTVPDGTIATHYFVDLGGGETLIATTYELEEFDYEANREVLDAMMETLDFTGE